MSVNVLDYRLAGDIEMDKLVHHHKADENYLLCHSQIYIEDSKKADVFCW